MKENIAILQRQWIESKATKVAEKLKEKEERKQEQFNKDIDTFAVS